MTSTVPKPRAFSRFKRVPSPESIGQVWCNWRIHREKKILHVSVAKQRRKDRFTPHFLLHFDAKIFLRARYGVCVRTCGTDQIVIAAVYCARLLKCPERPTQDNIAFLFDDRDVNRANGVINSRQRNL